MKRLVVATVATCLILTLSAPLLLAQKVTTGEEEAIEACARDYIDGWYEGDTERMARALHSDLAKRSIRQLPNGTEILNTLTASNMIEYTRAGFGKKSKQASQHNEVIILDVLSQTAAVKTISHEFIDYLHLAKINGKWWIVNVLWEPNGS